MRSLNSLFTCFILVVCVEGLRFDLGASRVKCFSEDIPDSTLVVGRFSVDAPASETADNDFPINVQVTDPLEKVLVQRDNITTGSFAFTTSIAGDYIVCFHNMAPPSETSSKRITLSLKHGVDAQDYSKLMRAEHLTPLQAKLRQMQDLVTSIFDEFIAEKRREESMRDLSELTCERVAWFALLTIVILVTTSVAQSMYLRTYLRRKKII